MNETLPLLVGGVALFLYAIMQLSETMKGIFSENAKGLIEKYTSNIFAGILIGTLLTMLLGSSSAIIILTIIFINAGTLQFRQAIGIIMGANIGTAFSSQIIALDIGRYSVIPLFAGLLLSTFSKSEMQQKYGSILTFIGMLFFGLFIMEESVAPLKDSPLFEHWITRIADHHVEGALIGGLITLIIQSSSTTVGIGIVLGRQDLISVAGGIALMLGAELGTCSDTLLATIKGSRQALKAGLFHLLFNFITIATGLIFFNQFVEFIAHVSIDKSISSQIANAHVLFNIIGVLLFIPFTGLLERALNFLLPDKLA